MAIGLIAGAGAGLILEMAGSAGASPGARAVLSAATAASTATTAPTDSTAPAVATPPDPGAPEAAQPDPTTRLQAILKPLVDDGTRTRVTHARDNAAGHVAAGV